MKGLDDAVIVAVPLGFNQVDLAVIPSEVNRVYGKYKVLSFEQFSADDPVMQCPNFGGEIFDSFRACLGRTVFEHYRLEFLRTYSTQSNLPFSQTTKVWAWFDSRSRYLNHKLGTAVTKGWTMFLSSLGELINTRQFTLKGIFFPAAQPALKCLLLLAEASSDPSIIETTSPTLIEAKLTAYDKWVDDIIAAIAMELDQESLAKLAVTTWIFDTSQFPTPSASLFNFLSGLTESSIPRRSIAYRQCREVQNKSTSSQYPRRYIAFLIGLRREFKRTLEL